MARIDLHTHSTASDGSLTPEQLVQSAKRQGVTALAVTDHDTIAGLPGAMSEGERIGVTIIPGIEISCLYGTTELHILGFFIDPDDPRLAPALASYWASREERNPRIVQRLQELGCDLTYADVKAVAGAATIGRPHIAQALLRKGYVRSVSEAFDRYLADDAPAYIPRPLPPPIEAIGLIKQIGGVPVLAHPVYTARLQEPFEQVCATLKGVGLLGLECLYSSHNQRQTDRYCGVAREQGLLVTGGSDFHGEAKPSLLVGTGYGSLDIPADLLEPIRAMSGLHF
jgi:predicted metal-dependent phosphoesterase TrpH